MKAPTKKQINQQIAALKKMKPRVLHFSGFDDDHHAAIDAQVSVLENRLTEDDLYEKQSECLDMECSGEDDINWHIDNIYESGLEAARWLAGDPEAVKPTDNWKPLMDRDQATVLRPSKSILR